MLYVYILEAGEGAHFYVGVTDNVEMRLGRHNAGEVTHTAKHRPWRVRTYVAFSDANKAYAFERYLKSGSGRAFSTKRL